MKSLSLVCFVIGASLFFACIGSTAVRCHVDSLVEAIPLIIDML